MAARIQHFGRLLTNFANYSFLYRSAATTRISRYIQTSAQLEGDPIKICMPALSPTMQEGTIVKWHKQEGDTVNPGDVLCDIQTDKAVVSLDTEEEGILAKILKPDDSKNVQLGTLIALMVAEGEEWQNIEVPSDLGSIAPERTAAESPGVSVPISDIPSSHHHGYGPAVRSIVDMYNLSLEKIQGTGPHKRILKGDLLKYIKDNNLSPAPPPSVPMPAALPAPTPAATPAAAPPPTAPPLPQPAPELEDSVDLELTNMRKVIAKRLTESKTTIPHAYATISCRMDTLLQMRKDLISDGIKVSVNDFIVKAVAVALQRVPEVNAVWSGESGRLLGNIDISVAVATDNGLITPIVKDAIGLGIKEISETVKELADRARLGKLQPHEFQGGSFTISNLGMFGISEFSAVINPPQACILAIGGSQQVLTEKDGQPVPETHMTVTLSADGRMVDEFLANRFLEAFRDTMENPMLMLSHAPKISLESLFAK